MFGRRPSRWELAHILVVHVSDAYNALFTTLFQLCTQIAREQFFFLYGQNLPFPTDKSSHH